MVGKDKKLQTKRIYGNEGIVMWKKPEILKPEFNSEVFEEMSEKEQLEVDGESVGTCFIVGYSCWSYGGLGIGTCFTVGYSCWSRGN